jgi:acyl-CoA thioesterase YciA
MNFKTRKLIKYEDLNSRGSLFGGQLLKWIDEEASIYTVCQLETNKIVTKLMSEINFMKPAYLNDIIEIGVDVVSFGRTSITLEVVARIKDTKNEILKIDEMVFVSIDENGRPIPHGKTEKKI